ncbi:SagB/ThcOx family dehydrogenase [Nitrosotalea sinensis]|uniref:SagB/ThcOx family dehydrogenase n=1 Tax=Nitrosotalea sinensis TaxID=1499975 RepID=UPI001056AAC4|nr:SagB/ThcOx family dehydrogenase [Candidatus Nitrosotalea sinensis]
MRNYEIDATWHYHNGTKHPNGMLLNRFHVYHPSHRPTPYKVYKNTSSIELTLDKNPTGVLTLDAISSQESFGNTTPDLKTLAKILYCSAGITKKIKFSGLGEVDFRAASCTGALYHIEIYIVCGNIPRLDAGVYHFDPKNMRLDVIRHGDYRGLVVDATANEQSAREAPVILIFTDVFSRNSIKYQARAYRHTFWDSGTILANTLAISSAHKTPTKIIAGFTDAPITKLLGVNPIQEAPILILTLGRSEPTASSIPHLSDTVPDSVPSDYDIEYPEITQMHDASSLLTPDEVSSWRVPLSIKKSQNTGIQLGDKAESSELIESTIIKRGSTRKFSLESITLEQLTTILDKTTHGINTDFSVDGESLSDIYIIANAVDGLEPGSYYYAQKNNSLEKLRQGNFRNASGNLGLDQDLPYDASVTIFFMTDLDKILKHFGNRGYRVAQLDAAITAGKMYLASYSLGLGATGLTFYDDLVTNFFSPHAKDKEPMFLMAIGKKEKST